MGGNGARSVVFGGGGKLGTTGAGVTGAGAALGAMVGAEVDPLLPQPQVLHAPQLLLQHGQTHSTVHLRTGTSLHTG